MRRAGSTNTGSRSRASSVICHDRPSITTSVSSSVMRLLTTPDSVQVKARWAPITSLLSRLTRAPVRVRVKKATGMRCTWPNTATAQVEDQALADAGRLPALGDAHDRVEEGDAGDEQRQRDDPALVVAAHDLVDDLAGQDGAWPRPAGRRRR